MPFFVRPATGKPQEHISEKGKQQGSTGLQKLMLMQQSSQRTTHGEVG
jgi:hypothetical protein